LAREVPASIGPVQLGQLGGLGDGALPTRPGRADAQGRGANGTLHAALADRAARIGPVIRELERATDPLFRQAGMDLDA
jgi:hypothetical protein